MRALACGVSISLLPSYSFRSRLFFPICTTLPTPTMHDCDSTRINLLCGSGGMGRLDRHHHCRRCHRHRFLSTRPVAQKPLLLHNRCFTVQYCNQPHAHPIVGRPGDPSVIEPKRKPCAQHRIHSWSRLGALPRASRQ